MPHEPLGNAAGCFAGGSGVGVFQYAFQELDDSNLFILPLLSAWELARGLECMQPGSW